MGSSEIERAPWWRRRLADLLDGAIGAAVAWSLRDWFSARRTGTALSLLAPGGELVREQLASPGQRLAGVRTVDRRTGRRLQLWRTLLLIGVRVGGQLATARFAASVDAPGREHAAEALEARVDAARRAHEGDPAAADAAAREAFARSRVPGPGLAFTLGPFIAAGVINNRLRRRLAPTVEVRASRD